MAISALWSIREEDPALIRYGADVVGAASLRCEGEGVKVSSPAFRPQASDADSFRDTPSASA